MTMGMWPSYYYLPLVPQCQACILRWLGCRTLRMHLENECLHEETAAPRCVDALKASITGRADVTR